MKRSAITKRLALAILIVLCHGIPIRAVAQSSRAQPGSVEAAEALYWERLTVCPIPNETGKTAAFDYDGKSLNEYRGWWKKLFVESPTEAERLNGMQTKAHSVLGYAAHRSYDPKANTWSPFKTGTSDATELKTLENAFYANYSADYNGRHADLLVVSIERRNGIWYFERMVGRVPAELIQAASIPSTPFRTGTREALVMCSTVSTRLVQNNENMRAAAEMANRILLFQR